MGFYVTLTMRIDMYGEIIDNLMLYSSYLDNYSDIEDIVHLIDFLGDEYEHDIEKQNQEYRKWQEYEELFNERFGDGEFLDDDGNINEKGMYEYKNFNKVNKVLEDYKEGGTLDMLDEKQQFFLVLDLINTLDDGDDMND